MRKKCSRLLSRNTKNATNPDDSDDEINDEGKKEECDISKLSIVESDEEKEVLWEHIKKCCCKRWMMDIIVNILHSVSTDFQKVKNSGKSSL